MRSSNRGDAVNRQSLNLKLKWPPIATREVAPNVNETVEAIPGEQDAAMDVDGMANQPPDCDVVVDGAPEMIPDVDEASAELADEGSVSGEPDAAADHDGGWAGW